MLMLAVSHRIVQDMISCQLSLHENRIICLIGTHCFDWIEL